MDKHAYYEKYVSRGFSAEFKSLFDAMCCYDPTMRLSVADILVHPWLQNNVASPQELA